MAANGHTNGNSAEIILYTNHSCPWAHRAHIALAELGLSFKEEIIDLSVPRTAEYLAINPRGLVPTLKYNGEIIPESAIVAQFLADQYPSHLVKTSSEPGGALQRARINFFVDALINKVQPNFYPQIWAKTEEEKAEKMDAFVNAVVKEVEPLLKNAAPFFGGSSRLTLAEVRNTIEEDSRDLLREINTLQVLTGSFILRFMSFPKHGLLHSSLLSELESKTPHFYKWANAVIVEKSVNYIWDEDKVVAYTRRWMAKMAATAK
jgi:glutathione S-transferase